MAKFKGGAVGINPAFTRKKENILRQLSLPNDSYGDLSPKGSIDAEIRAFVDEINSYEGLATTSSCSGRVSVFLEGRKGEASVEVVTGKYGDQTRGVERETAMQDQSYASKGGKGGGGEWLFVSHNPVPELFSQGPDMTQTSHQSFTELFDLQFPTNEELPVLDLSNHRLIHFKFEPMILHILASDPHTAQRVLSAASQSGFRESGASGLPINSSPSAAPIPLAIRSTGIAFDNIIGFCSSSTTKSMPKTEVHESIVPESYLRSLVLIANEKFYINKSRTERFRALLAEAFAPHPGSMGDWEDADERKRRKRAEGLMKKEELRNGRVTVKRSVEDLATVYLGGLSGDYTEG